MRILSAWTSFYLTALSSLVSLTIVLVVSTTAFSGVSASTLILDVSGSAGDLAALRLIAATSGSQIALITVCGHCGTSPVAAWSRVRRFANWIGLRSVRVVLGSTNSWYDRDQILQSDSMIVDTNTGTMIQPTCRGARGIVAPTAFPYAKFVASSTTSTSSASAAAKNPLSSDTIVNSDLTDWGSLYNTFDLDSWFGLDEEMDISATVPSSWIDTTMLPSEIAASTSAVGTYITSARLSSPAVLAMRDTLKGSAVKILYLCLSSSLTNLADYLRAEQDISELLASSAASASTTSLQNTYTKIAEIHVKGGCLDPSACILTAQTGKSPKLTTAGLQKGEWNFAMDPEAATFVLGSFNYSAPSSSSQTKSKLAAKIPRFVYTEDMLYFGTLMSSSDWERISTNLVTADSIFAARNSPASTYQNLFGGSAPLVWLGKAFSALQSTWMNRASDFILVSGAGFFNVFRASEIFVALAVVDATVQLSLTQQLDVQPKFYDFGSITGGGGVVDSPVMQSTWARASGVGATGETNLKVFTRGPTSTIPFWQSVTRNFFGFV